MEAFQHPPSGFVVDDVLGTRRFTVAPYRDSGMASLAFVGGGFTALRMIRWFVLGAGQFWFTVAIVALMGTGAGLTWRASRRRNRALLRAVVTRDELRVEVRTDGRVDRSEIVQLKGIERVTAVNFGRDRWHVVADLIGGRHLVIEMERDGQDVAVWVASQLQRVARAAAGSPPG